MKKFMGFALITILLFCGYQVMLEAQYHWHLASNRYWSNAGVLSTDGRIQSISSSNGLRLGVNDAVYTDIAVSSNGVIEIEKADMSSGDSSKILDLDGTATYLLDGIRQGALVVTLNRSAGYAMTTSGGNADTGAKITVQNRTASEDYYRGRGLQVTTEIRDTSPEIAGAFFLEGAYISVKNRSGTTMSDSGYMMAMKLETNHNATGTCEVIGLNINEITQSSTASAEYAIKVTTGNYNITRTHGFFLDSTNGSWTNGMSFNGTVTNVFDFENTNGTNGAGYNAGFTGPAAYAVPDGYMTVDVGGNTVYLYLWTTKPT